MGNLTLNFSDWEFECECCGVADMNPILITCLQNLRNLVGVPITITSGFRCAAHNKAEGGDSDSQHLYGRAADIVIKGYSSSDMYVMAEQLREFREGGIGLYPKKGHLHVDVRGHRARWGIEDLRKIRRGEKNGTVG